LENSQSNYRESVTVSENTGHRMQFYCFCCFCCIRKSRNTV